MVLLGLLLIVAGSAALATVFAQPPSLTATPFTILGRTFAMGSVEIFLAGAVTAVTLLLGMVFVINGLRRGLALRQHLHRSYRRTRERLGRLEEEKRALQRQLDQPAGEVPAPAADQGVSRSDREPGRPRHAPAQPGDRLVAGHRRNSALTG